MIANNILETEIPILNYQDSAINGLSLMDEYDVIHLPVLNGDYFVGLLSEEAILNMDKPDLPLTVIGNELIEVAVSPDAHIYEVLKVMASHNISMVPVIEEDMQYLGYITQRAVIKAMARLHAVEAAGGVIVLEMNHHDYSLSKIAQIVEGNDAKIMSASLTGTAESNKLEVTLKVNQEDLNPILQTFNRYDYTVKAYFQKSQYTSDIKNRYEELMKYLNM